MIAVRRKFTTFQLFVKVPHREMGHEAVLVQPSTKQPSTNYNAAVDVAVAAAAVDFYVPQIEMEQHAQHETVKRF